MEKMTILLVVVSLFAGWLYAAWLDNKHNWQLIDWFNGKSVNPFRPAPQRKAQVVLEKKDQQIAELKERIQVLEKIVTEPAYELNKKINQL